MERTSLLLRQHQNEREKEYELLCQERVYREDLRSTARQLIKVELVLQPIMFLVGFVNLKGAFGVVPYVVQVGTIAVSFLFQFRTFAQGAVGWKVAGGGRRIDQGKGAHRQRRDLCAKDHCQCIDELLALFGRNGSVLGGGAVLPSVDTVRRAGLDRGLERGALRGARHRPTVACLALAGLAHAVLRS